MKVSLGWLSDFVDLPASQAEFEERLTLAGLEIEGVESTGPELGGVVVGRVIEREPHPRADRLSLCRVDLGTGEPVEIVCGAPNVRADLRVAVAPPGTVLPDGTKLKKARIRGIVSSGMICSSRELGLGDDHEGILELPHDSPVGAPLDQVVGAGDTVLDFEITPNRGDWASMLGMAREVRAHFGGELRLPDCDPAEGERDAASDVAIEIHDPESCHRYVGRVVRGVAIGPSPDWLVERLRAAGLRSINNVVDVSNLVLLEFGQPLHTFDLARLRGAEIRVRRAEDGEEIVTLDGERRELGPDDLVIADAERPVAVAGVMGGADTEVHEATREVLIESAHFDPVRVRRTARRLGLRTEASYRFERGVDSEGIVRAVDRCARLIAEIAGGEISRGRVEAVGGAFRHCGEVELEPDLPARLLGVELSESEVVELLARVDIPATLEGESLRCRIPSYRNDLRIPQDLVEEVGRIHGYDRIPYTLPSAALRPVSAPPRATRCDLARDSLSASGLLETRSIPMGPASDFDALRLDSDDPRRHSVRVVNPIVESDSELRTSLLPGLLRAARRNLARQVEAVRLFEIGRVFLARDSGELPDEPDAAAALLTAPERTGLWETQRAPVYFEAKGVAEKLVEDLGLPARFDAESGAAYLHPGACSRIRSGRRTIGWVGELHPAVSARYGIEVECAVCEIDLSALPGLPRLKTKIRPVSAFPASRRDLAVLVDREQPAGAILDAIRRSGGPHLADVELFDCYEGRGIPEQRRSLAFHLVFQRTDRTLTEAEVGAATDKLTRMLTRRFGGELRQVSRGRTG